MSLHIAPSAGAPMRSLAQVTAIAGVGLEGDRYAAGIGTYSQTEGGGRHLTLIEAEVLDDLARAGIQLRPEETRRNVVTRGVALNGLVGARLFVGDVLCEAIRLCEPCDYLAELAGKPVLRPLAHRGGLRLEVVRGGLLRVGDPIHQA